MSDFHKLKEIIRHSNVHGVSDSAIKAIAHGLQPGEVPLVACHVQEVWVDENLIGALVVVLLTDARIILVEFLREVTEIDIKLYSMPVYEVRGVSELKNLEFSITGIDGSKIKICGISVLSTKDTLALHEAIAALPRS
ncbi:MAG: hypothetical protein ACLQRH_08915 [Acidimicrobiales bacterium]